MRMNSYCTAGHLAPNANWYSTGYLTKVADPAQLMTKFNIEVFDPRSTPDAPTSRMTADFGSFLQEFRGTDWDTQVAQAEWAGNGWPGIAVVRESDGLRLWVCAYDWAKDLGYIMDQSAAKRAAFIVGLMNVPPEFGLVQFTDGRVLSDSDFLIMEEEEVESLAELFFAERMSELVRQLLQSSPVNRFSGS